jgi:hypothetical protein
MPEQRQDQPSPTGQFHSGAAAFLGSGALDAEAFNNVEEALRKLRPQVRQALIDDAEAALEVVRADASPQKLHGLKIALDKIVERLAINATDAGIHEAIHELVKFSWVFELSAAATLERLRPIFHNIHFCAAPPLRLSDALWERRANRLRPKLCDDRVQRFNSGREWITAVIDFVAQQSRERVGFFIA